MSCAQSYYLTWQWLESLSELEAQDTTVCFNACGESVTVELTTAWSPPPMTAPGNHGFPTGHAGIELDTLADNNPAFINFLVSAEFAHHLCLRIAALLDELPPTCVWRDRERLRLVDSYRKHIADEAVSEEYNKHKLNSIKGMYEESIFAILELADFEFQVSSLKSSPVDQPQNSSLLRACKLWNSDPRVTWSHVKALYGSDEQSAAAFAAAVRRYAESSGLSIRKGQSGRKINSNN